MRRLAALLSVVILCSCSTKGNLMVKDIDAQKWDSPLSFIHNNHDTTSLRTIDLLTRYSKPFEQEAIEVVVRTITPDGQYSLDTIVLNSVGENSTSSRFTESRLPYRTNCLLSQVGEYIFEISPLSDSISNQLVALGIIIE